MNQDRLSGSAFAVITQEINASRACIENENRDKEVNVMNNNETGGFVVCVCLSVSLSLSFAALSICECACLYRSFYLSGLFSRLRMCSGETSDGLAIDEQSNHSMSNGIALKQEIKRELLGCEQTDHQSLSVLDSTNSLHPCPPVSSCLSQIRAADPRKALANFWPTVSTNQDTVNPPRTDLSSVCTKKTDSPALCTKKRWIQMAKRTTATQAVTSSYLSTCSDTTRTESVATLPLTVSPTIRHEVSTIVDSYPSVVTSSSCNDPELGIDVRDQGGKGGKRKVSLWEYRNRKRDVVPKDDTQRGSSSWLSESIRSTQSRSVSAFGMTHMFNPVTNFEATNESVMERLPQPHTPPDMPVIEPVTPEGYQSDSEATNQSQFGENYVQWEKEPLRDKKIRQLDWTTHQTPPVLKPPRLPDLPPLPSTPPPPPPPPEDVSVTDFSPVSHQVVSSQFQPWTAYSLLGFQAFQQQQGLPFVQSSHGSSWSSFPAIGRTNYSTSESTQYTLGVSPSSSFPTVNPNGPYYH